jgi:hypothetical protein
MSDNPSAAKPTMMRAERVGWVCAPARCPTAGNIAAPDGAMKLHATNKVPHFFRGSTSFAFAVGEPIPVANKMMTSARQVWCTIVVPPNKNQDENTGWSAVRERQQQGAQSPVSTTHVVLRLDTAAKCA